MGPAFGACFSCSRARLFDLLDLLGDELLARKVALQLGERVGRNGLTLGRAQLFEALRRLLELGIEVANAKARQCRLDAVDDGGLLANEGFALAMGTLAILLHEGRDGGHLAVVSLAAQPAQKGALELLGVESIGLGAPVLARHRHARGMNDMGLDTARSQPAGQPEAVPAGLEGNGDAGDLVPCLLRLGSPALEQLEEFILIGCKLLQRLALHAGDDPGNEPAFFAEFDHGG